LENIQIDLSENYENIHGKVIIIFFFN